ncbi:uncharacterized protein [Musca autumnalis]|uniref:uncharacterized protein n=1 Tax=Musca autumnalis TaxID=221902 RepID=UPI003CF2BE48
MVLFIKNQTFFHTGEKRIELLIFQDAFEVCNPLGSSKKKHKPLLGDLKRLETEGIIIFDRKVGIEKRLYGTVVHFIGDKLGSHQIGGFTENFSFSQYVCRYCFFERKSLSEKDVSVSTLRNVSNYNDLILSQDFNKGVLRNSCLNSLKYFHVCNPGLPPCIAHDLFEGIVPFDLLEILKSLSATYDFSFDYINAFLQSIQKKFCLRLSFPKINVKMKKLPGKADEIRHMLFLMPHVLMSVVKNFEDPVYLLLSSMINMCRLICAQRISETEVELLNHFISMYFVFRQECFPNKNLRPKHHFLQHYPDFIRQFGPLKNLSTLHFEHKHQYFKSFST